MASVSVTVTTPVLWEDGTGGDVEVDLNNLEETGELETADFFNRLPPEMVTSIFEHLENSAPLTLLSCRLTCHRFRNLIDDLLEKQQVTLWDWSRYYGEAKPFIQPGPLRRHLPVNKIFSRSSDIANFLNDMKGHLDDGFNPFPNRGIYLRRVKSNPPSDDPDDNLKADLDDLPKNKLNFLGGLGLDDNPEESEAYLLSFQKVGLLLTPFGGHLTSLILECGITTHLKSLEDLRDILEKVPNLQYLMLKGIRIHEQNKVEHLQAQDLPELPNLKSLKVIRCNGILEPIIYAYHNQLECFQMINTRDNYFPSIKNLLECQQQINDKRGLIFGKLRELKIGEFGKLKEFNHFVDFIKRDGVKEEEQGVKIFPKLDHLSVQYSICGNFCDNPVTKIFEPLQYLGRLKEFNVGLCGDTQFKIGEDEINGKFNCGGGGGGGGGGKMVKRLSLPVHLIRYPGVVVKVIREMGGLEVVRFLRNNEDGKSEEFSEEMEQVLDGILQRFPGLSKVEIVDVNGDREQIICGRNGK